MNVVHVVHIGRDDVHDDDQNAHEDYEDNHEEEVREDHEGNHEEEVHEGHGKIHGDYEVHEATHVGREENLIHGDHVENREKENEVHDENEEGHDENEEGHNENVARMGHTKNGVLLEKFLHV